MSEPSQYPPRLAARDISLEILAHNVLLFPCIKQVSEKFAPERLFSLGGEKELLIF